MFNLVNEESRFIVSDASETLGVPGEVVVDALNDLLERGSLSGFFSEDGSMFVKQETLRDIIKKRLDE